MRSQPADLSGMSERQDLVAPPVDLDPVELAVPITEVGQPSPGLVVVREEVPDRLISEQHDHLRLGLLDLGQHLGSTLIVGEGLGHLGQLDPGEGPLLAPRFVLPLDRPELRFVQARVRHEIAEPGVLPGHAERAQEVIVKAAARGPVELRLRSFQAPRALGDPDPRDDLHRARSIPEDGGFARNGQCLDEEPPIRADPTGVDGAGVHPEDDEPLRAPILLDDRTEGRAERIGAVHGHRRRLPQAATNERPRSAGRTTYVTARSRPIVYSPAVDLKAAQRVKLEATIGWARKLRATLQPVLDLHGERVHFRPSSAGVAMIGLLADRPQRGRSGIRDLDGLVANFDALFAAHCRDVEQGRETGEKALQSFLIREVHRNNGRLESINTASRATDEPVEFVFITDEISLPIADGKIVCDLLALRRDGGRSTPVVLEMKTTRLLKELVAQVEDYSALVDEHADLFAELFGALLGGPVCFDGPTEKWIVWPAAGADRDPREDELALKGIRVVGYTEHDGSYVVRVGRGVGRPER